MTPALQQFLACVKLFNTVPFEEQVLVEALSPQHRQQIDAWYQSFLQDIYGSQKGYALQPVYEAPVLEDRLLEIAAELGILHVTSPYKQRTSALCLSHDIDYLYPTTQMKLKRLIGYRKWPRLQKPDHYLDSIERLLTLDHQVAGGIASVFVPSKTKASGLKERGIQWLIDPDYPPGTEYYARFKQLLMDFNCEIGLHGSFLSLEKHLLETEREQLQQVMKVPVTTGRQHWLHLPHSHALDVMKESGIEVDSTLGWNGQPGFRCGMARPFPIVLKNKKWLWEVPLVVMDGPLFDDLRLDNDQAADKSIALLDHVKARNGCVAINWHDRAAHPDYQWDHAYSKILAWAKEQAFEFVSISHSIDRT